MHPTRDLHPGAVRVPTYLVHHLADCISLSGIEKYTKLCSFGFPLWPRPDASRDLKRRPETSTLGPCECRVGRHVSASRVEVAGSIGFPLWPRPDASRDLKRRPGASTLGPCECRPTWQ
eukprot:3252313-Prymnesium_polylepis.1